MRESSPTDRLVHYVCRLFICEPVAASAVVLVLVGAFTESASAGWVGFAAALLLASQLQRRRGASPHPWIDSGVLFLAGLAGILDASLDLAEYATPSTFSALCGAGALGAKKLLEGWRNGPRCSAVFR